MRKRKDSLMHPEVEGCCNGRIIMDGHVQKCSKTLGKGHLCEIEAGVEEDGLQGNLFERREGQQASRKLIEYLVVIPSISWSLHPILEPSGEIDLFKAMVRCDRQQQN
jgi:hypothetical protein